MYQNGISAYQTAGVLTADPKKIVLMCYELAIVNLKKAKTHFELKEFEAKAKSLQKVIDVLHELRQALDFQLGGEVAKNLDALYHYMSNRLIDGDLKKDAKAFDEVIDMFEELLSAWKEIFTPSPVKTAAPAPFVQRPTYGNQAIVQYASMG
ncbi:MAG TPA: flagellar export chaperone FliS [Syntrophales bacterium]|nr:flagellar export chaperone FliS [Syntrophales bacterium]